MKTRSSLIMIASLLVVLLAGCVTEKQVTEKQPEENKPFEGPSPEKAPTHETYPKQSSQIEKSTDTEVGTIDACMEITEPGYYVILASLSSSNSCIIIKASNVVLDGNGQELAGPFDLKYDKAMDKEKIKEMTKGSGIVARDVENITIKN